LIVNGDTLTDLAIPALLADHHATGALVTMAVTPNDAPDRYGGVAVAGDGTVTGFVRRGSREPSWHFVGVQAAEPGAFAGAPDGVPDETVARLYPDLFARRPGAVRAYRTMAEFLDVGTPGDYLASALRLADREGGARTTGDRTRVAPSARVERSLLWDDVDVEEGAFLQECIVADGVRVPAGTAWHGVTIRRPEGELAPGERRIEGLAIAPL
jgi:NDP-sugar pyrophosphorylase family protein